jgi:hypothetical protein
VYANAQACLGKTQGGCAPGDTGTDDCDVDGALMPRRRARHCFVFEPVGVHGFDLRTRRIPERRSTERYPAKD